MFQISHLCQFPMFFPILDGFSYTNLTLGYPPIPCPTGFEQPSLVMASLSHAGQDQPKGQEKEDERHAGNKSLAHGVCDGYPYQASDANPN